MIPLQKPKIRRRQVKKALTIIFYSLVAVTMVAGMVAPAFARL